jgi:predicted N-acyltransferase
VSKAAVTARIADGVASIAAADWDACAGTANPFTSHGFLAILEESGSAVAGTGWQPIPIVIDGADNRPAAIAPAYGKSHSQGEYVFDHGWADAWERAGGRYYPKLQVAVPFTPAPGPRLLLRDPTLAPALIAAIEAVTDQHKLSSAHATFIAPEQLPLFEAAGWLIRAGTQYHWQNQGYANFEDFLGALASRKRKAIRKERAGAVEGITVRHLTGSDITEADWDAFWIFYQDTGSRKWGRPYLTRAFFSLLGYYQAIDAAIALGLKTVEAGAQGEHKLARGYIPVPTWSAHYIPDAGFRRAVAQYLEREREAVATEREWQGEATPFRRAP